MMAASTGAAGKTWPPRAVYSGKASGSRTLPGIYFFTFIFFNTHYTWNVDLLSTLLYDHSMCRMYSHSINLLDSIKSLSSYSHDDNVF